MKVSGITPNYYSNYNRTKANNAPAFKGTFKYQSDCCPDGAEISKFFENYMSPCVRFDVFKIFTDDDIDIIFSPFMKCYEHVRGLDLKMPAKGGTLDSNFYITNAKAIEDDLLDFIIDYYTKFVNKEFEDDWRSDEYYDIAKYLPKYYQKQLEYAGKYPERLSATYKPKLALLKDIIDSKEYKNVCKTLKSFIK